MASIFISRDINYGIVIDSNAKNKNCGVEVYNPHYCVRQLGCVQSIPYPFFISSNKGLKKRAFFTEIDQVTDTSTVFALLKKDFVAKDISKLPSTTRIFDYWWKGKDTSAPR